MVQFDYCNFRKLKASQLLEVSNAYMKLCNAIAAIQAQRVQVIKITKSKKWETIRVNREVKVS
jgi:hypothetical protein